MRKFVFVFTGPTVCEKDAIPCEDFVLGLTKFAELVFRWQSVESHCVPLDTTVQIGDKTK
jgi:hypothetical protein